jgi:N-hydroxyarylamine O-acetyltransferase
MGVTGVRLGKSALGNADLPALNQNQLRSYLERIGYTGPISPSIETLRKLHQKHLLAVPFENLDIPLGRKITLSYRAFYQKIVRKHRGGFCYELNGSFANLLHSLGFDVALLSGRVARGDGTFSAEFDHMTLRVRVNDASWIADVGFGSSFSEPKNLDLSDAQDDSSGSQFKIARSERGYVLLRREGRGDIWTAQYRFSLKSRKLKEFAERCVYQQTSPRSHFTQGWICTRLTANGRLSLTQKKFIITTGKKKTERPVKGRKEFDLILKDHFGIVLN